MKDPLVTVYVTNYNYGSYIEQAVESVLRQTFGGFELIIIDDGSTDSSREILRQYDNRPQIRLVFQENKGLNASNNVAVKMARGRYVMRLDADDYLDDNALLVMTSVLEKDPAVALVFPDYYLVDKAGKVVGQERRHNFQTEVTLLDQPAHGACTMIRRDCLIEVNAYSENFRCQDGYDLWLKIVDRYPVRNVNLPLFYYRQHGGNLTENQELILETRSQILKVQANRMERPALRTVGVIPVLGPLADPRCLSLTALQGKPLLFWTIEAALGAEGLDEVIVSSPDPELLAQAAAAFPGRITTHLRPRSEGRENVPYDSAVFDAIAHRRSASEPQAVMLLTIETPFRSSLYVDKAINVMRVFDVDVVLGVQAESDLFFQHDGSGLKPLGNSSAPGKLRFERDYLYRFSGGTALVRRKFYEQNPTGIMTGRIGHFILSRQAATTIRSPFDLAVASAVLANN